MRYLMFSLLLLSAPSLAQQWKTLEAQDRPITVSANGIVAPRQALRFGPPPSQSWRITITKLTREGTRVKTGDVLAEFDGSATDDRIKQKQGELATRQSELTSLFEEQAREVEEDKVRLAEAESNASKAARKAAVDATVYAGLEYKKLLEEKSITAELYAAEQQRSTLVKRVRASKKAELESDIRRLQSELDGAKTELESFTIRAPRDGLVIVGTDQEGQKLDVNDSVNPGMTVVEVIDDSDLIIEAEVPEFAAASITVGQPVSISLDAAGGSELRGNVIEVASIVRRQSRYSQAMVRGVTIEVSDEAQKALRPGTSAKITLTVDTREAALAVSEDTIRYRDGKPGLMVRGDGWRAVRLGDTSAGLRIIESGVSAGEEVAL